MMKLLVFTRLCKDLNLQETRKIFQILNFQLLTNSGKTGLNIMDVGLPLGRCTSDYRNWLASECSLAADVVYDVSIN